MTAQSQSVVQLYGIAIDLTPFDVVGAEAPDAQAQFARGAPAPEAPTRVAEPSGVTQPVGRRMPGPRVIVVGEDDSKFWRPASVALVALALMFIVASMRSVKTTRTNGALEPAYTPAASAGARTDGGQTFAGKAIPKSRPRATQPPTTAASSRPTNTASEGSPDKPAEPLASTLDRLRGGI